SGQPRAFDLDRYQRISKQETDNPVRVLRGKDNPARIAISSPPRRRGQRSFAERLLPFLSLEEGRWLQWFLACFRRAKSQVFQDNADRARETVSRLPDSIRNRASRAIG